VHCRRSPLLSLLPLFFAAIAQGSVINIGLISFDVLSAATSNSPQVDVFNITNFTGDPAIGGFDLPPDFPVATLLTFTMSTLTIVDNTGTHIIPLGDIGPGPLTPPNSLQFPDTDQISSATFSATLDQTHLLLSDGSVTDVMMANFQALLLPSIGPSLVAGTDFTVATVETVPEPGTLAFMLGGLAALFAWIQRRRGLHKRGERD
jgi:PEP-CTERM motif